MAEKPKKNRLLVSFCITKTGNMHRLPITHFEHMQQIKQKKKLKNYKVVINDNWHELTKYSVMVYLNHTQVLLVPPQWHHVNYTYNRRLRTAAAFTISVLHTKIKYFAILYLSRNKPNSVVDHPSLNDQWHCLLPVSTRC